MKKSAKNGQSKRNKKRRVIEIKQSKQISPVKQTLEPQQSRIVAIQKKVKKIKIPPLVKHEYEFSNYEIEAISTYAGPLISVELMKKIIQREQNELKKKFIMNCPPIMQKAFGKALKNVGKCLNHIKQERVQRIKQKTIVFVPPDRDKFQKQKGKVLSNWMKQILSSFQKKRNFQRCIQIYRPIFKNAGQKIKKLSSQVRRDKIQPDLERIVNRINLRNVNLIESKLTQRCLQMKQIMAVADEMRRIRYKASKLKDRNAMKRKLQQKKVKWRRYQTHSFLLYRVKDYFF